MSEREPSRRKAGSLPMLLGVAILAIAIAVATQRALAEQVGGAIAGALLSAIGAVLTMLAAFFRHA